MVLNALVVLIVERPGLVLDDVQRLLRVVAADNHRALGVEVSDRDALNIQRRVSAKERRNVVFPVQAGFVRAFVKLVFRVVGAESLGEAERVHPLARGQVCVQREVDARVGRHQAGCGQVDLAGAAGREQDRSADDGGNSYKPAGDGEPKESLGHGSPSTRY